MKKNKVLVVVGPTAVGKTALGIQLAQKFGGAILSCCIKINLRIFELPTRFNQLIYCDKSIALTF